MLPRMRSDFNILLVGEPRIRGPGVIPSYFTQGIPRELDLVAPAVRKIWNWRKRRDEKELYPAKVGFYDRSPDKLE